MRTPILLALSTLLTPSAWACGGFFCDQQRPVDQKGEDIFFAVDKVNGKVEMHVQIEYEGPAEEFAWILPVPNDPQLDVGSDAMFDLLSGLRGRFTLNRDLNDCAVPDAASSSTASFGGGGGNGGVNVVRKGLVGPYETVTLQANDSTALINWLQTNGFFVPSALDPLLDPYISERGYFVGLRLAKDKDTGDIEPLVLKYDGDMASIPIQLTSVAATPDMRLRVYVAGPQRAVPDSYYHVQLNELAIDWWRLGANLEDAITAAADEAGGHAFFTDYSGPSSSLQDQIFNAQWDTVDWASLGTHSAVLEEVVRQGLPTDEILVGVLADHLGLPETSGPGLNIPDLLDCHNRNINGYYGYYGYYGPTGTQDCSVADVDALTMDHAAFAADLDAIYLTPRRTANAALKRFGTITRMTSSVSPSEMTVDPTFVFNPDMGPVDQNRFADEIWFCQDGDMFNAPRELHLSDGRVVSIPSQRRLSELGMSEFEWLESNGLTVPVAAVIEDTSGSGTPDIVVDNRELLDDQLDVYNELEGDGDAGKGCGCTTTGGPTGWMALLPLVALVRRRR